jgi:signal transduction histidine kinase
MRPELTLTAHAWRYALCLVISVSLWSAVAGTEWREHRVLFWAELVLGVVSYVLVWFRRSAPVTVALLVAGMSTFSGVAAGPATLAGVSVATYRRVVPIVVVGLANFVAAQTYTTLAPWETSDNVWISVAVNAVVNAGMMGWGMYIGSRRELLWTLRHRAQRAEDERDLRVGQARVTERARIAREMHDVLAHRITQVSMQAGALGFRDDLDAPRLRDGLAQIQGQANAALHELRGILGVLRDDTTAQPLARPQPTYDDVALLVDEARRSGMNVQLRDEVADAAGVPDGVGRTVYRIVQEGLTNARKHAPGALLTVHLGGSPAEGIDVWMRNPLGFAATATPGAGLGLVGLRERTELSGGRLDQWKDRGTFVLHAWIPWAP